MLLMSVVVVMSDYFVISITDDSWYINDDDKLIHRDMIKLAHWELNRKSAGIDDKKDELELNQVRFSSEGMFGTDIMIIYEDNTSALGGLMNKDTIMKIIAFE
jgi:hypothetical protein